MSESARPGQIDLGRREFYWYCRARLKSVYLPSRPHLEILCNRLETFVNSDTSKNLIICMPPRFGKSTSVQLLSEWYLGHHPDKSIITASYNELLSSRFSRAVKGGISERPVPGSSRLCFADFFPGVRIKEGDSAMQMWSLEGSFFSYLATSPKGTVTGVGATGLMIIDDVIKNAEEAYNERVLTEIWEWYCNTMLSRCEVSAKKIVIMTRWATQDLVGRLLAQEPEAWEVITMPAQNPDGSMLCESILSRGTYEERKRLTDPVIIAGNYQQQPYDSFDLLYTDLKTYSPDQRARLDGPIHAVVDTADTGSDFLCCLIYRIQAGKAYILDVLYTQDPMEVTEPRTAEMLASNQVEVCLVEANNGGRNFARSVREHLIAQNYPHCLLNTFAQRSNKVARILSNATAVKNLVIFPDSWASRWPKFYKDLTSASRLSKWIHDDAMDAVTLVVEQLIQGAGLQLSRDDLEAMQGNFG